MGTSSAPHWLAIDPVRTRRLVRHELVWPDGRPHSVVEPLRQPSQPPARQPGAVRIVRTEQRQFRVLEGGLSGGKNEKS
jgi:hypothetical protein